MPKPNVVSIAKADLGKLLKALGHNPGPRAFRKTDEMCWCCTCDACGREWYLRFRLQPSTTGKTPSKVAVFPTLGDRCPKKTSANAHIDALAEVFTP